MDLFEDYVSYDTAKLLKEKGFNWPTYRVYYETNREHVLYFDVGHTNSQWDKINKEDGIFNCSAPTLQMAMKWLREEHKFYIEFVLNQDVQDEEAAIENYYIFNVSRLDRFANEGGDCKMYHSYEEACDAAIRYCLVNLI